MTLTSDGDAERLEKMGLRDTLITKDKLDSCGKKVGEEKVKVRVNKDGKV